MISRCNASKASSKRLNLFSPNPNCECKISLLSTTPIIKICFVYAIIHALNFGGGIFWISLIPCRDSGFVFRVSTALPLQSLDSSVISAFLRFKSFFSSCSSFTLFERASLLYFFRLIHGIRFFRYSPFPVFNVTIKFILGPCNSIAINKRLDYFLSFLPVLPNPPSPRSVSLSSSGNSSTTTSLTGSLK